ncbi:MAG: DUF6470 family protein [Angelakisella sp.]
MQLIKITTTPTQLEFSSRAAKLQQHIEPLGFTVTKSGGSLEVNTVQSEMTMNSDAFRHDMNLGTISDNAVKWAQAGKRAGHEAVGRQVDMGNQLAKIHKGANIPDTLFSRMMQDGSTNLVVMPLSPVDISWSVPQISMDYTPVKQNFDWQIAKNVMEFVPGKFSIAIRQYPNISFEYTGGFNYVPRRPAAK